MRGKQNRDFKRKFMLQIFDIFKRNYLWLDIWDTYSDWMTKQKFTAVVKTVISVVKGCFWNSEKKKYISFKDQINSLVTWLPHTEQT